jgi:2-dehydro-3-deoxy-D-gluconate 5-dehydrogenase
MRFMERLCDMLDLSGKTAIVTGGSAGIGYGISYRLAEAGMSVVIANRNKAEGAKAANEIRKNGWKATAIAVDVSVEESVKDLVEQTVETYGEVDVLVNNAGVYPLIPLREMSLADFDEVIAVNLKGTFLCTKYVSERMVKRERGGRIVNITSIDALHPSSVGLAHYDASKHGVWGFTKNIALELAPYKIWVNAVAPGGIMTPGVQKLQQSTPTPEGMGVEEVLKGLTQRIPMQRLGIPDDIGKVVVFLASDMASYMTGSQIVVDGGLLLM